MNGAPALAAAAPAMVRPWQRSRGAMWLSALLMVVLLAGFDLPTSPVGLAGPATVEAGVEFSIGAAHADLGGAAGRDPVAGAAGVEPLPRILPRTRAVHSRGLPPPRAP